MTHRFATVMRFGASPAASAPSPERARKVKGDGKQNVEKEGRAIPSEDSPASSSTAGKKQIKNSPALAVAETRKPKDSSRTKPLKRKKLRKGSPGRVLMLDVDRAIFIRFPRTAKLVKGSILGVCRKSKKIIAQLEVTAISSYEAEPDIMLIKARVLEEDDGKKIEEGDRVGIISYAKRSLRARR